MKSISAPDVQRILLATDFSRWTSGAVEYAFEMARCFDAEVLMIHGIEPISDNAVDDQEHDEEFEQFFGDLVEQSRQKLEQLVELAEQRDVKARFHIEIGERWRIVLDQADAEDVDLIVLGRRSPDEQPDSPLGTTSQRVYFGSERPVLTVPSSAPHSREAVEIVDE